MAQSDRTLFYRFCSGQEVDPARVTTFLARQKVGLFRIAAHDFQKLNHGLPLAKNYSEEAIVRMRKGQNVAQYLAETQKTDPQSVPVAFYLLNDPSNTTPLNSSTTAFHSNKFVERRNKVNFGTLIVRGSVISLDLAWKLIDSVLPAEEAQSSKEKLLKDISVRGEKYAMPAPEFWPNLPIIWAAQAVTDPANKAASIRFILPQEGTVVVNEHSSVFYVNEGMDPKRQNPKHSFFVQNQDGDQYHIMQAAPMLDRVTGWPAPFTDGVCGFRDHAKAIAYQHGRLKPPLMALRCFI